MCPSSLIESFWNHIVAHKGVKVRLPAVMKSFAKHSYAIFLSIVIFSLEKKKMLDCSLAILDIQNKDCWVPTTLAMMEQGFFFFWNPRLNYCSVHITSSVPSDQLWHNSWSVCCLLFPKRPTVKSTNVLVSCLQPMHPRYAVNQIIKITFKLHLVRLVCIF